MPEISKEAFDLIVQEEVSSQQAYEAKYRHPEWPGGNSGVTIGIGYDLRFSTVEQMRADWGPHLPPAMIAALEPACAANGNSGQQGEDARALAHRLKASVDVPWDAAMRVFAERDMPKWSNIVANALPNADKLSPDSFGALVSLTYNRGASFNRSESRYAEMRNIKVHMTESDFGKIPAELRSMKRLWPDLRGLRDRRDHEAQLFERGLTAQSSAPATSTVDDNG